LDFYTGFSGLENLIVVDFYTYTELIFERFLIKSEFLVNFYTGS